MNNIKLIFDFISEFKKFSNTDKTEMIKFLSDFVMPSKTETAIPSPEKPKKEMRSDSRRVVICETCGKEFKTYQPNQRCCSSKCAGIARKATRERKANRQTQDKLGWFNR